MCVLSVVLQKRSVVMSSVPAGVITGFRNFDSSVQNVADTSLIKCQVPADVAVIGLESRCHIKVNTQVAVLVLNVTICYGIIVKRDIISLMKNHCSRRISETEQAGILIAMFAGHHYGLQMLVI